MCCCKAHGFVGPSTEAVGRPWSWRKELVVSLMVEKSERVGTCLRGGGIGSGCSFVHDAGLTSTGIAGATFGLGLVYL